MGMLLQFSRCQDSEALMRLLSVSAFPDCVTGLSFMLLGWPVLVVLWALAARPHIMYTSICICSYTLAMPSCTEC